MTEFVNGTEEQNALLFYHHCRPVLRNFAIEMERTLRDNDFKGGWRNDSLKWLMIKLVEEVGELAVLVRGSNIHIAPKAFMEEATDVANMAMMVADKAQQLVQKYKSEQESE